jgi:hypothetical protein
MHHAAHLAPGRGEPRPGAALLIGPRRVVKGAARLRIAERAQPRARAAPEHGEQEIKNRPLTATRGSCPLRSVPDRFVGNSTNRRAFGRMSARGHVFEFGTLPGEKIEVHSRKPRRVERPNVHAPKRMNHLDPIALFLSRYSN